MDIRAVPLVDHAAGPEARSSRESPHEIVLLERSPRILPVQKQETSTVGDSE